MWSRYSGILLNTDKEGINSLCISITSGSINSTVLLSQQSRLALAFKSNAYRTTLSRWSSEVYLSFMGAITLIIAAGDIFKETESGRKHVGVTESCLTELLYFIVFTDNNWHSKYFQSNQLSGLRWHSSSVSSHDTAHCSQWWSHDNENSLTNWVVCQTSSNVKTMNTQATIRERKEK